MASSSAQKLKVLHLMDILRMQTDPEHGLTMPQIVEWVAERGSGTECSCFTVWLWGLPVTAR